MQQNTSLHFPHLQQSYTEYFIWSFAQWRSRKWKLNKGGYHFLRLSRLNFHICGEGGSWKKESESFANNGQKWEADSWKLIKKRLLKAESGG